MAIVHEVIQGNPGRGHVEVDRYFEDRDIFLEVVDTTQFEGDPLRGVLPLTSEQALAVADALYAAVAQVAD